MSNHPIKPGKTEHEIVVKCYEEHHFTFYMNTLPESLSLFKDAIQGLTTGLVTKAELLTTLEDYPHKIRVTILTEIECPPAE